MMKQSSAGTDHEKRLEQLEQQLADILERKAQVSELAHHYTYISSKIGFINRSDHAIAVVSLK